VLQSFDLHAETGAEHGGGLLGVVGDLRQQSGAVSFRLDKA
jgi:hypothetical protein